MFRKFTAVILIYVLCFPINSFAQNINLQTEVSKSYAELMSEAPSLSVTKAQADAVKKQFNKELEQTKKDLDSQKLKIKQQAKELQKQLDKLNKSSSADSPEQKAQRQKIHCAIIVLGRQLFKLQLQERDAQYKHDNNIAKLDLLVNWPSDLRKIQEKIATGQARHRKYGDVEDIGFRKGFGGQEKDIPWGREIIEEAKRMGVFPPEIDVEAQKYVEQAKARYDSLSKQLSSAPPDKISEDQAQVTLAKGTLDDAEEELTEATYVVQYIRQLAVQIGKASDLKVPLHVYVLWDDDPNAFSLPGGYVFVNSGLLYGKNSLSGREFSADNVSEIAGVLAHEISHVVCRDAARLRRNEELMNLVYQGSIVAALIIFSSGLSTGLYYAIQYAFVGLGILLSLEVLGISRSSEARADKLGVQYTWNAGYNPKGFIDFFDKMASNFGYVEGGSFFRDHPPFYNRIRDSEAEIMYLPKKENLISDTPEFQRVLATLKDLRSKRFARVEAFKANMPTMTKPEPPCGETK
jgi:Zn-dependent protease with chaperone function